MKLKSSWLVGILLSTSLFASEETTTDIQQEIYQLKQESQVLQKQVQRLQKSLDHSAITKRSVSHQPLRKHKKSKQKKAYHVSPVQVQLPNKHPEALEFYPTALMADNQVITYIAGTPVVSSPYLGARPAFDGSDYIVNISSINRDLRLMQQRRNLYRAYQQLGFKPPDVPIIAVSGKVEPIITAGQSYFGNVTTDLTLGSDELDIAAILKQDVEAYMGIAYNSLPVTVGGRQRVANAGFSLNMGFVNIGNLDKTPLYMTMGQLYAPFGRYSSAMVSPTLPMILSRIRSRPIIVGYKSQQASGPIVSLYGFKSDTTEGRTGVGGVNFDYIFKFARGSAEAGAGIISSINDATGIQYTGSTPGTTFGGFASLSNGSEYVNKIPAVDVHANVSIERYSLTGEFVSVTRPFAVQDLSFDGHGALTQAAQGEVGVTFLAFNKPSSLAAAYQWSGETLALNMPHQRISGVFNISIWEDTLESLEYRHDMDFATTQYANGANAPGFDANQNTVGTGKGADSVIFQIGVFF